MDTKLERRKTRQSEIECEFKGWVDDMCRKYSLLPWMVHENVWQHLNPDAKA